jgi:predicted anti-sigma-YlaC factor YlaD
MRMQKDQACENYEALLEDYLSGELDGAERARAERHVIACRGCRSALSEATSGNRLFEFVGRFSDSAPTLGPDFARVVMARIRAEDAKVHEGLSFWQPFVSMAWKFAATAAFGLALLLTYTVSGANRSETEVASVSQLDTQDLFSPDPTTPPTDRDEVFMMVTGSDYGKH